MRVTSQAFIFTKKDLTLIIPYVLFVIIGMFCINSVDFIENDVALSTAINWFTIPSTIIALYYAYRGSFGYNKKVAKGQNFLTLIVLTVIVTMSLVVACQGYLVLFNCNLGIQKHLFVKGTVVKLSYPRKKKLLNSYSIEIATNDNKKILKLNVPTNQYFEGQTFEKEMIIGSIGFIYSK